MGSYKQTVFAVCVGICISMPLFADSIGAVTSTPVVDTPYIAQVSSKAGALTLPQTSERVASDLTAPLGEIIQNQNDRSAFGFACASELRVVYLPQDMTNVTISAPCNRDEVVQILHAELSFETKLSDTGEVSFSLPIMHNSGEIETIFENSTKLSHKLTSEEILSHDSVAVEWADANIARISFAGLAAPSRKIVRLGDGSGRVIDIALRPRTTDPYLKVDRLIIVSEITQENCATVRKGKVRRVLHNQPAVEYALSIAAPGCSRVGMSMVLKNVLQDLKLAED